MPTPCDPSDPYCAAPTPNVTMVVFEQVNSPIDSDPNFSGGKRIFPDKNINNPSENRKVVKVKATIGGAATETTNVKVTFKAFDVDDPSSDTTIDPNNNAGNDNHPFDSNNPHSGLPGTLSDDPTQAGTSNEVTVGVPLGTSETFAYLTVTMQPGNNVVVAATTTANMNGVTIDGVGLKDGQGNSIPTLTIKRTELLTTWRKLHIEVDSMGAVTRNKVEGTFPANKKIGNGTKTLDVSPSPSPSSLEVNRFENGKIKIGNNFYPVIASNPTATPPVNANTANTVTIFNNQGTFNIIAGDSFTLYDDDDMNDDGVLDGDEGDDVRMPDLCLVQGEDTPSTTNCPTQGNGDSATTNVFAAAYVRPIYDIGDNNSNVNFSSNVLSDNAADIRMLFDIDYPNNINTDTNPDFWTVYILGAYQHTLSEDNDSTTEPCVAVPQIQHCYTHGIADRITNFNGEGSGILVFTEIHRPTEIPNYSSNPSDLNSMSITVAHELGHLLSGRHIDGGLMDSPVTSTQLAPKTIFKIRGLMHP